MTSRKLRVDRGGLYTPHCTCVVCYDRVSSVFCFVITLLCCSSQSTTPHSFLTFTLGLIPCHRLSRFLRVSEFLKQLIFFSDILLHLQFMPRRPPPTPLHLVQGPLPPRGRSKFTMPSIPRPIFHPQKMVGQTPVPRERVHSKRERETGWRVEGHPKSSPSPRCTVRTVTTLVVPPKAAGTG